MFVRKNEDETTSGVESGSLTESAADPLAGADQHDEQTAEQTAVESDATVDANTDGLSDETDSETTGQTEAGVDGDEDGTDSEIDSNADTFSRAYVEKLRRESAGYRERAQRADELAARLHTALVAATGRMADPTDLAFDAAHLDDPDALNNSINELLARKPHLATRKPFGDVGQGNRGASSEPVNLADMLRARA